MAKALVVYFSHAGENPNVGIVQEGNTALFAKNIIERLKADGHEVDEFELKPTSPYPEDYNECILKATEERTMQERPDYEGEIDLEPYSTIFIGYPIWWSDMPMIVYNFLEKHTFTGKNVAPFCTSEGSGEAGTFGVINNLAVGGIMQEGLAMPGTLARQDGGKKQVQYWVGQMGI